MKKQIITWVMALALMASIVASTGTPVLGDLQAQLSQLESDLKKQEQSERIWREAVNSNDVVFLPARVRFLVAVPVFMGKEEINTMIVLYAASRGLSKEEIKTLFTEIWEYDTALRKEIRERYLPLLREQISSTRSKESRIRAEMADLEKHGPDIPGLIGEWEFGQVDGDFIGTLNLTETKGQFGYVVIGDPLHPNESFWKLEGNELVIRHTDGQVTSRLTREKKNYWEGPYYERPGEDSGIVHYIKR